MLFANIKIPQAALSRMQKAEIVHRLTALFVDHFGEAARPHTMVLIEEVLDGAAPTLVFVVPDAYRASDAGEPSSNFGLSSAPPLSGSVIETRTRQSGSTRRS